MNNRNSANGGGFQSPIILVNNPRKSGKLIAHYGALVVDLCTGSICVHDGVTPGGCYCFNQPIPLCDEITALPNFGVVCAPPPPPPPFDACALMSGLPDFGVICVAPTPPPAPSLCASVSALSDFGPVC